MSDKKGIVWFRNDLRVHDNEALCEAISCTDEIIPVFVFDPRVFRGRTAFNFDKTGKIRRDFIEDAVAALKEKFESKYGGYLLVFEGKPEEVIYDLAQKIKSDWVFCNRERTSEEVTVQDALEKNLWSIGQEIRYSRGKMLLYTADLPFPVNHTPDHFNTFKKEVKDFIQIRPSLEAPDHISFPSQTVVENDIKLTKKSSSIKWSGGEDAALIYVNNMTATVAEQFNDKQLHIEGGSFLSPWLASGCLSPKMAYHTVNSCKNKSNQKAVDYFVNELLFRDHLRLMAKKHGNLIFQKNGIQLNLNLPFSYDKAIVDQWINGETPDEFINAAMNELRHTGFLHHRLRVLVASYFVQELKQNWQIGASYFESVLIDYDPCSNYGNWNTIAGIAADGKEEVSFNIENQQKSLDPDGNYIKKWAVKTA